MRIAHTSPEKVQQTGDKAHWAPCQHVCSHHWALVETEDSLRSLLYFSAYLQTLIWSCVTTQSHIHPQKKEIVFSTAPFMSSSVQLQELMYFLPVIPHRAEQHSTPFLQAQYFLRGCTVYIHSTLIWDGSVQCNSSAGDYTGWNLPKKQSMYTKITGMCKELIPLAAAETFQRQSFGGASPSQVRLHIEKPRSFPRLLKAELCLAAAGTTRRSCWRQAAALSLPRRVPGRATGPSRGEGAPAPAPPLANLGEQLQQLQPGQAHTWGQSRPSSGEQLLLISFSTGIW